MSDDQDRRLATLWNRMTPAQRTVALEIAQCREAWKFERNRWAELPEVFKAVLRERLEWTKG